VTAYETLFIVHPERGVRIKELIDRFKKVVEGQAGVVANVDEWGLRDLAYKIDKQGKGFYTLIRYESAPRAVEELERNLKLTDGILRYLTVRLEEEANAPAAASKGGAEAAAKQPAEPQRSEPAAPAAEAPGTQLQTENKGV
jgi:small subunit ribosomal protein S6